MTAPSISAAFEPFTQQLLDSLKGALIKAHTLKKKMRFHPFLKRAKKEFVYIVALIDLTVFMQRAGQ